MIHAPMIHDLTDAAEALAAVLTAENTALAALDLPRAASLVPAKRAATDSFLAAQARLAAAGRRDNAPHAALGALAPRLRDLAAENRHLLDRAMATQRRVLDIIAQAVPRASAQAPRYGASGALLDRARALPVAIASSA